MSAISQVRLHPVILSVVVFVALHSAQAVAQDRRPIIDMHMHAAVLASPPAPRTGVCTPFNPPVPLWDQRRQFAETNGEWMAMPPCDEPVWSAMTDEALLEETIAAMERSNVFGVVGGMGFARTTLIDSWIERAPARFWAGIPCVPTLPDCSIEYLRQLHAAGRLDVLAELYTALGGIGPADERLEPYWVLAEELDIPVGIHVSAAIPPGSIYSGTTENRARLHSPLALEEVLVRHPRMRVYVMHAGYPMLDEMLAVLHAHPQVYVGIGAIVWHMPREGFYRYLGALIDSGFGQRVLFGSDNLQYPGLIERSIVVIEEASFLNDTQKRDILYNNAARFLRLTDEEIARHHGR